MEKKTDEQVAVPFTQEAKKRFPSLTSCSYDKGFHSRTNRQELESVLNSVILPKKGKRSKEDKERETADEFVIKKRQHSAIESAINAIENHGLDRCPDHGIFRFQQYVALAVFGRNLQILGHLIQQQQVESMKRHQQAA